MALQGNLQDFSLVEILQLIAVQRKSGVLRLSSGPNVAVLFFEKGNVVALSDRRDREKKSEPLLHFLRTTGRLSNEHAEQVGAIRTQSKKELPEIIIGGGYMSAKQLTEAIEQFARELLPSLLTWKRGTYVFSGDERTVSRLYLKVPMRTEALLMECMRRIDESARMKELYSPSLILRPTGKEPPEELGEHEKKALPLADGKTPIYDIVVKSRLGEFRTYEALDRLVETGLIEITDQTAEPPGREPSVEVGAKVRLVSALRIALVVAALTAASLGVRWAVAKFEAVAESSYAPPGRAEKVREEDVRLAIEVYKAAKGVYPDDLRQLVSEGLAVEATPSNFNYAKTPKGFALQRKQ
ncbi:MAG: DUF4388 domain-containing protein [Candidatus Eisenbacteria bacterium]|nr:DUF4388 domain-containing protein [Candidatus Eisenbacteria bacterium]